MYSKGCCFFLVRKKFRIVLVHDKDFNCQSQPRGETDIKYKTDIKEINICGYKKKKLSNITRN